ncbi:hypothetical protein BDN71DRAFT_1513132 [Pleurotus eryngii]|uniref:Uncharacterized protein n=1 Tax=Pleurotus eryngii TaxID=5323 RepID=A0A9P5ZJ44_PLEER|nr:hypothetical protein BDN71DRAFT_1513132 [Pleurotus eryngii]
MSGTLPLNYALVLHPSSLTGCSPARDSQPEEPSSTLGARALLKPWQPLQEIERQTANTEDVGARAIAWLLKSMSNPPTTSIALQSLGESSPAMTKMFPDKYFPSDGKWSAVYDIWYVTDTTSATPAVSLVTTYYPNAIPTTQLRLRLRLRLSRIQHPPPAIAMYSSIFLSAAALLTWGSAAVSAAVVGRDRVDGVEKLGCTETEPRGYNGPLGEPTSGGAKEKEGGDKKEK